MMLYDVIVSMEGKDHIVSTGLGYHEAVTSSQDVMAQMKDSCVASSVRVTEKEGQQEGARWLV
jgi:hypothetical protein